MAEKLIFLAGIHGVGKGYFSDFLSNVFDLEAYSASALIKAEKKRPVDHSKIAVDPEQNQDLLVAAFSRIKSEYEIALLDGHFVLMSDSGYFEVPIDTFRTLDIDLIILKTLDVDSIHSRLLGRDGESPGKAVLEEMQAREESRALHVARQLSIPIFQLKSDDFASSTEIISSYLK